MNKKEITKLLEMINDDNIESLKSYLNDELTKIKLKETYGNNYVSATKKIKKYLDKAGKTRPILNYYDIQNGKQCFTDSFFAFRMNEGYYLNNIEYHNNEKGVYPDLREFIPKQNEDNLVPIDDDKILNPKVVGMCGKDIELYQVTLNDHVVCVFNLELLKLVIQLLGDEVKMYVHGSMRPVLFVSDRGEAVICPIRIND